MPVGHTCPHGHNSKECGMPAMRDACNLMGDTIAHMQVQASRWNLASMPEDTSSSTPTEGVVAC